MHLNYKILAIDTSCDETSVAVSENERIQSNIIASQATFHQEYGGVVPFLAKRMHHQYLCPTLDKALTTARVLPQELDAVAVTHGPGLAPALEAGIKHAKKICREYHKPLIAVNHMEGHLLSSFVRNRSGKRSFPDFNKASFPLLGLLISGGHTQLVLMKNFGSYRLLGETLDDAAGEAFDKVAKMLNLGYPGGPIISELAKKGKPVFKLPVPMKGKKSLNFSYSGLKTACFNRLSQLKKPLTRSTIENFASSFVYAVTASLTDRLEKAIIACRPQAVILGGGVISNLYLRKQIRKTAGKHNLRVYLPYSPKLFTDNAAMIAVSAFYQAQRNDFVKKIHCLDRQPNLNF